MGSGEARAEASESESVWKEAERGSDVRGVQAVCVQREHDYV
jgi:hypothetical protein